MPNTADQTYDSGQPVELYEFRQGELRWYFADGNRDVNFLSRDFIATDMDRSEMNQSADLFKNGITITFPLGDEFAGQYIGTTHDEPTIITNYRGQYGSNDFDVYWKGRVLGSKASKSKITLDCESVFTSIRRYGLRQRYERNCRHTHYKRNCGLNRDDYASTGTVTGITNGTAIDLNGIGGAPDGHYTAGIAKAPDGAERFIRAHAAGTITITRPFNTLQNNDTITLYPGCDRSKARCIYFNNYDNNGAFLHIPDINPYGGNSIL